VVSTALEASTPAPQRARVRVPTLPALVVGTVAHRRPGPVRHGFQHAVYQWLVDLDALPDQPWWLRPFAGFRSRDHLGEPDRSIKANVEHFLAQRGIRLGDGGRVVMLANARVLGHVFDPLSVFWCLDRDDALVCVVAEVHNTYGERHVYLLEPDESGRAVADKEFYVSPFNDLSGRYEMRFTLEPERVATTIALRRGGEVSFTASLAGRPVPATRAAVVHQLLTKPLMPQRVSALIRAHGVFLWLRRLPVVRRPHHRPQEGV
jgi:DUF1365 family protein